jgi:hypothetical protein
MKGVITIFVMPQELEDFALTLNMLKRNSVFLDDICEYHVDITLCLSDELTDWENTKLPKKYIEDRTKELCQKYLGWCTYSLIIERGNEIIGCLSHRRRSLKNNPNADFFIWLDTDILFKDTTLYYATHAYKMVKEAGLKMFVITPEFVRQWDNTWDVIVNKEHLNNPLNYYLDANIYYDCLPQLNPIEVKEIPQLKFAGGWFTLISNELLTKVGVPESFGHYGPDDTFIMICGEIMKQKQMIVSQFIMENMIAGENHKRANSTVKDFIASKNRKDEFRKIAEDNWEREINKFIATLN